MSTTGRAEHEGGSGLAQAGVNSLDQVREILFGSQHREFASRLARTDAHVTDQAEKLRNEIRQRLEVLEVHVRKQFDALHAFIQSQRSDQLDALHKAACESRNAVGLLDQRLRTLEEYAMRMQSDVRQQILEQAKSFIDEVQRTRDTLAATFERELAVVRGELEETDSDEATSGEVGGSEERERPPEAA